MTLNNNDELQWKYLGFNYEIRKQVELSKNDQTNWQLLNLLAKHWHCRLITLNGAETHNGRFMDEGSK